MDPTPEPAPLLFTLGALTINISADNVAIDNYNPPFIREGILVNASIPLSVIQSSFVYLTDAPDKTLFDNITSCQFACVPTNKGTAEVPNFNYDNIIPSDLDVGFVLPNAEGYFITNFTSSSSPNKSVGDDLLNTIATYVVYTNDAIATALEHPEKKHSTGSYLSDPVGGIVNGFPFKNKVKSDIKSGFSTKLASFGLTNAGEGTPYSATAPTDATGQVLDFAPGLEVARKMFNNAPYRLKTIGTAVNVPGLKEGFTAFSLPILVDDILDFNIVATTTQSGKSGTTIPTVTYRIRATIVA